KGGGIARNAGARVAHRMGDSTASTAPSALVIILCRAAFSAESQVQWFSNKNPSVSGWNLVRTVLELAPLLPRHSFSSESLAAIFLPRVRISPRNGEPAFADPGRP